MKNLKNRKKNIEGDVRKVLKKYEQNNIREYNQVNQATNVMRKVSDLTTTKQTASIKFRNNI